MEKKSVGLLELEMAVLECFLEKTPLSPLGVKKPMLCPNNFRVSFHMKENLAFTYIIHLKM
jgi:hypothetical protein